MEVTLQEKSGYLRTVKKEGEIEIINKKILESQQLGYTSKIFSVVCMRLFHLAIIDYTRNIATKIELSI